MEQKEDTVVEVKNLSKVFGRIVALDKVNLTVKRGEFLTLFGPNGAGKTTLIKILSTLTRPSSGQLFIDGHDTRNQSAEVRRKIGVISHETFLYDDLTAWENLRFYGKMYDVPELNERIEAVLEQVGLRERQYDRVHTFSRGMKQRLTIARAILHEPFIMFLDEPYTGLDQQASDVLTKLLKEVMGKEKTILMTTHDMERGLEMADRIVIIVKGRIVYEQNKESLSLEAFRESYRRYVGGEKQ